MIVKSAIAAHVALLKKHAAMMPQVADAVDPNEAALTAAKEEAARKKALAGIAVEQSGAKLATAKAADTVKKNEDAANAMQANAAQEQGAATMPATGAGVGAAPTTPGMPAPAAAPQTMAGNGTVSAGSWGMQPYSPQAGGQV